MTYDRSFPLELRPNWGYETTSETHDTLLEEVSEHLTNAPNVRSFHPIFADYHTNIGPIGFLVILEDEKRLTVLASERDVIHFGPEGEVVPGGPDFLKQDNYRVIYSPWFAHGDELPYDEFVPTAKEAYDWWLKDMRGNTTSFRRMEKRTIITSDWSEVRDA